MNENKIVQNFYTAVSNVSDNLVRKLNTVLGTPESYFSHKLYDIRVPTSIYIKI